MALNTGSALIWASIFLTGQQATLHGLGYAFFVLAILPIGWKMGWKSRAALQRLEVAYAAGAGFGK